VAGALQDHKRAVIMGTQTFGKGSVQTILPLGNTGTAIKLTTARYFTPNGRSIQAKGITPDIIVEDATVSAKTSQFQRMKEADLNNRLENPEGESKDVDNEQAEEGKSAPEQDDYQLSQALNLLKGLQIISNR
jgi:carboxyl-terminal processing protease